MKKKLLILLSIFLFTNVSAKSFVTLPNQINEVGISIKKNTSKFEKLTSYFEFKNSDFYHSITGLLVTNTKKIIDISSHQKQIDWDILSKYIDGVIIRIGYGSKTTDNKFEEYINEIKRLNIPYGIYLYSYAENVWEARDEADFTIEIINKYDLKPTLGIYYDIEEFYVGEKKFQFHLHNMKRLLTVILKK